MAKLLFVAWCSMFGLHDKPKQVSSPKDCIVYVDNCLYSSKDIDMAIENCMYDEFQFIPLSFPGLIEQCNNRYYPQITNPPYITPVNPQKR
jgi:hypothetical protein